MFLCDDVSYLLIDWVIEFVDKFDVKYLELWYEWKIDYLKLMYEMMLKICMVFDFLKIVDEMWVVLKVSVWN